MTQTTAADQIATRRDASPHRRPLESSNTVATMRIASSAVAALSAVPGLQFRTIAT